MTFVEELVDYLINQGVFSQKGGTGGDIFYSYLPDVTASPVCVLRDTGGPTVTKMAPIGETTVQMIIRANDYTTAMEKAADVYDEFHGLIQTDLTNNHVIYGEGISQPYDIGPDKMSKGTRHLISCNFHFRTRPMSGGGEDPGQPAKGGNPNVSEG